jgi:CBS domain containing-hemolysin-like protein
MPGWVFIIAIIVCILAEGFFSGAEIAIVSASKIKLNHLAQSGSRAAQLIQHLLRQPAKLLSTTLVGTNISTIVATALTTTLLTRIYHHRAALYATLVMFPLTLVFGEIIPKTLYHQYRNRITPLLAYPLRGISVILAPVVLLMNGLVGILLRLLKAEMRLEQLFVTKEELRLLVAQDQQGQILERVEREMISRIFDFGNTLVKEALVPLIDVVAVPREATIPQVINLVQEKGFSRFPVYYERVDNIIGVINSFDLIYAKEGEQDITRFIGPAYYVPETMRIDNLLKEFQQRGMQMAIVVDEYGNSQGIVTLEDILEEIVGEIHDEYDAERQLYQPLADGSYIVDARMELDHIREKLGLEPPEGDFETLGGLMLYLLGKIPDPGEKITVGNLELTVLKADGRSIKKIKLVRLSPPAGEEDDLPIT